MVTNNDFSQALLDLFQVETDLGHVEVNVEARALHRRVGDYPNRGDHRMPMCCKVMRGEMRTGDVIVVTPPKGNGASLTIKYVLPRPQNCAG